MVPLSAFSVPRPALAEMCRISRRASREILNGSEVDSDLPDAEGLETLDLRQASVIDYRLSIIDYRVVDHCALIVEDRDHRLFVIVFLLRYSIRCRDSRYIYVRQLEYRFLVRAFPRRRNLRSTRLLHLPRLLPHLAGEIFASSSCNR